MHLSSSGVLHESKKKALLKWSLVWC